MSARRVLAIVAALLAAGCFAFAVQGGYWWAIGEIGVGPVSTQSCFGGECKPSPLAWAGGSDMWERAGLATYVAGLVAAAVLRALAGARAAGREGRLAAAVALVSTLTATVAGALFVAQRPELPGSVAGRGLWLFVAAVVAAALAIAVTLTRRAAATR